MLGGTFSPSPARLTTIVCKTKPKLLFARTPWTRILVLCADVICVFVPKHGAYSIFSYITVAQFL